MKEKISTIWITRVLVKVLLLSCLAVASRGADENGVCGDIDIRNDVRQLEKLANCTVIEGKLHILLIMEAKQEDYDKFSFPDLVEITGHLLLYRVYGLRTLRNLFPKLRVIRGQVLFYNYALVSFEMPDLEELGLISLNTIMRGAVRLEKNNKLCYIETIDWSRITKAPQEDHYFRQNKDKKECVNQCPENCPMTEVNNIKSRRCWTSQHCQGNLECSCKDKFCQDGSNLLCCHEFCVGGCTGPRPSDCMACEKVKYNGKCDVRCVGDTYMFMLRRCLLEHECIHMRRGTETTKWKLIGREGNESGKCVDKCPPGYTVDDENEKPRCKKCAARCPRDCTGKTVDSIDSAQSFKGCTKILGPLEIQITGGSNIGMELEESLGQIEEVTHYIKIVRSYALVSLDFFKSLRVIHGERLERSDYSLVIMDNNNLQELFPSAVSKNLKIMKGKISFHFNRKLCYDKIKNFLDATGFNDTDIDKTTNGDEIACSVTELNLTLEMISHDLAVLKWDPFEMSDARKLLGYVINYREVTSKNVSIYQGRDACSENLWKTKDVEPDVEKELLYNLKPWTMYAVYIQTYTLHTARQAAISNIEYFITHPYHPSIPTNLNVEARVEGELYVSWGSPKNPNGNVTHYLVYWQRQVLDKDKFDVRDYCTDPILSLPSKKETVGQEDWKNNQTGHNGACCTCPKSKEQEKEEETDRLIQIAFENHLQDSVYFKRPSMSEGLDEIASQNMGRRRRRRAGPAEPVLPPEEMERSSRRLYTSNPSAELSVNSSLLSNDSAFNSTGERAYHEARVFGTHIILPNLGHYQEYNIEVLACQDTDKNTGKYYCGNQAMATARTLKSDTADNISSSSVTITTAKNDTGVILKWESPPDPNGLIVSFEVEYKKVEVNDMTPTVVCTRHLNYRKMKGYVLKDQLRPGNYSFRIRAISLAGNGSWTDYFYMVVPDNTEHKPLDKTVLVVVIVVVLIIVAVTIVVVWFVAKSRFSKDPDMTTISMNPHYMPSTDVYIPDNWEVDRDKIKLIRELGQGSFGMVYEGEASDLYDKGVFQVAVKTVNPSAGWHERMSFLKEASIMKAFKCHHVVKLLGVVSKGQPALVIMELMIWGDLKKFLRMHRPESDESHKLEAITLKRLLRMAAEVSDGMAYLADKKFVHRDLAARNCMVGENMTVKIGDFGMTRDIYETDYYRKGGKGLLPVRWMAPESLKDGIFTTMSDVWSFGVVLWEMATLATQPYQGLSNEEVLKFVIDGRVMDMPDKCPDKLFNFMTMCWQYRAEKRPTFKQIIEILVPDLDPDFQDVSYFFSDENHVDEAGTGGDDMGGNYPQLLLALSPVGLEGEGTFDRGAVGPSHVLPPMAEGGASYPGGSDNEDEDEGEDVDEACVRLMGPRRLEPPPDVELQQLGRHPHLDPGDMNPCECALLEEMPNGHKQSECSSPVSAIGPSDDSKGSSKSSSSSYSHFNGLSNGHIHLRVPRTTPC